MKLRYLLILLLIFVFSTVMPTICRAQKKRSSVKKSAVVQKGYLSIEVGIVFTGGNVQPVARQQFYLLDEDEEVILKDFWGDSVSINSITMDLNFPALQTNGVQKTPQAIKPHVIASITTDFSGKAKFLTVKPGKYYLFGFTKAGKSAIVWNLESIIKADTNEIILDNNNAARVSNR
jgi:hypothetical protein